MPVTTSAYRFTTLKTLKSVGVSGMTVEKIVTETLSQVKELDNLTTVLD